mgnify:CR=1 FL=1
MGDLIFNGVASRVDRSILSNGVEFDSSYKLSDQNTFRAGFLFMEGQRNVRHSYPGLSSRWQWQSDQHNSRRVVDNHDKYGYFYGLYLQDEWKPFEQLTINFGGRLDFVNAFADENQLSRGSTSCMSHGKGPRFTRVTPLFHAATFGRLCRKSPSPSLPAQSIEPEINKDSAVKSERRVLLRCRRDAENC